MKVALVHDWLNTKVGGAERTLFELAKLYPQAPIYTLLYDQKKFGQLVDPERVVTSKLQRLPQAIRQHPRYLLPLIPKHVESFDFSKFDVVISNSSAFVKNIITRPETMHLCYCNSPMRFAWDYWPRYLDEQNVGRLRRAYITRQISRLRLWDFYGAARVDVWAANSQNAAARVKKYYHQDSTVIYPPVAVDYFAQAQTEQKKDYYVTLSALTPYKKLDLAIETFNQRGDKLVVIGEGADQKRLQQLARPNITFRGYLSEKERAVVLANAQGLIFPGEEDFGIAMVEALAAGTPVIAYNRGGAREIVSDRSLGVLFNRQTPKALHQALDQQAASSYDSNLMLAAAQKFNQSTFDARLTKLVTESYQAHVKAN